MIPSARDKTPHSQSDSSALLRGRAGLDDFEQSWLNPIGQHGYRACLGLLLLAKRYGKERLESACTLALQIGSCQCSHVNDILKNNRGRSNRVAAGEWVSPEHVHMRGPGYYQ